MLQLTVDSGTLRLPLCGASARELLAAMLADDGEGRQAAFARALEGDPLLVFWLVSRAEAVDGSRLTNYSAAAEWLTRRWRDAFEPQSCGKLSGRVSTAAFPVDAVYYAEQSLFISALAEELGEAKEGSSPAEARWLGLLLGLETWPVDGRPVSLAPWASAWLRELWLQVAAADSTERRGTSSAERAVAAARKIRPSTDRPAAKPPHELLRFETKIALRRGAWFAQGDDPMAAMFRPLVDRLLRLERLESDFDRQLLAAKLEALREFAYGAGHEINNPLANISTRAETLLVGERQNERRKMLATIVSQAFRAHEMISDMMLFARLPEPVFERIEAGPLLRRLVDEMSSLAAEQRTELRLAEEEDLPSIEADRAQLAAAVKALVANALEALDAGGEVRIDARRSAARIPSRLGDEKTEDETVEIVVADNGPGLGERELKHLFDPFFSGREAGRGLGLGLSKCWKIVQAHGGSIDAENLPDGGAVFTLRLPAGRRRSPVNPLPAHPRERRF